MQVLSRLGKLPLNTALTLIKAISKKKESVIAAERPNFLAGAAANGIGEEEAQNLFNLILRFAGYGFNKAHSTRYAIVAYQTAWFKCHWPCEFMAALLTFESGDTDKVVQYLAEARRMGIQVGPPDINACGADFTADVETIRFGLAAVKGVGHKAVDAVIEARDRVGRFGDLYHFCEHVDLRAVNRATIEALIKCGAFDALGAHRAAMLAAAGNAVELGNAVAEDRRSGQLSFFGAFGQVDEGPRAPRFPQVEPLSEAQLLQAEKESLGFYVTSHPLVKYGRELESLGSATCAGLADLAERTPVTMGCMVSSVRPRVTKSGRSAGKKMAILTVEDLTGSGECVVFSEAYERLGGLLRPEAVLFLVGTVDRRREKPQIIVNQAIPIDQAIEQLAAGITIRLDGTVAADRIEKLGEILRRHPGQCPIQMEVAPASRGDLRVVVRASEQWLVGPSRELYQELCGLLGEENVALRAKRVNNASGNGPGTGGWGRYYARNRQRQQAAFSPPGQAPG